jgi:hypothetical protein
MRSERRRRFRIIIQLVEAKGQPQYALVAYSNQGEAFAPMRFSSLNELTERFEAAGIPAERQPKLGHPSRGSGIIYSDDFQLSEKQLSILGLKRL